MDWEAAASPLIKVSQPEHNCSYQGAEIIFEFKILTETSLASSGFLGFFSPCLILSKSSIPLWRGRNGNDPTNPTVLSGRVSEWGTLNPLCLSSQGQDWRVQPWDKAATCFLHRNYCSSLEIFPCFDRSSDGFGFHSGNQAVKLGAPSLPGLLLVKISLKNKNLDIFPSRVKG